MKDFGAITLQKHAPLSIEEEGWVDVLRSIAPDGVPRPTLHLVQVLRRAMQAELTAAAAPSRNQLC